MYQRGFATASLAVQLPCLRLWWRALSRCCCTCQVSDVELEQIARLGEEAGLADEVAEGAGGDATRQLLGNYAQTPARFATPMRTPRTAAGGGMDRLMQEAQNLARMQNMQTPLLGGENPELHASDYSGVTPKPMMSATPNPLAAAATPGRGGLTQALTVVAATPSVAGELATPALLLLLSAQLVHR